MPSTAWVDPAQKIRGTDHLAVKAPCEKIYSQLIPGITNVTDRARLYSFYPWLIWSFEKHQGSLRKRPFLHTLRRAECLLTLIGAWHGDQGDEYLWRHGGGLVGRNTLLPILEEIEAGKSVRLSVYATLGESTGNRYFKNKLGGLGQYYLSTLRELGILDGNAREGVKYTHERGETLAIAFDKTVDRKGFFEVLEDDQVDIGVLKALRHFCPCYLKSNKQEQEVLTDLFFNREGIFTEEYGNNRRKTLGLILDLAMRLEDLNESNGPYDLSVGAFRACTYTEALPNGTPWVIPASLKSVQEGWRLYQRNELLSMAVQSVFWAGLHKLSLEGITLQDSEAYKLWFESTFAESIRSIFGSSFEEAADRFSMMMPPIESWDHPDHEIELGFRLSRIDENFDRDACHEEVLSAALKIILALYMREDGDKNPYGAFIDSPNYLLPYPVNLSSFYHHANNTWRHFTTRNFISWVAMKWGIETHLRVALRKLRYENRDTFRIKPTEQGLSIVNAPLPVFSNPRLEQAFQMLWDLDALKMDSESGFYKITEKGCLLKEECCG